MKQLRSELEAAIPKREPQSLRSAGPVLPASVVDSLLAEPVGAPDTESEAPPPPMYGIWLGSAAGVVVWLALAALFVWLR